MIFRDGWSVEKVQGGHEVRWRGLGWGMAPRSPEWCEAYMLRLIERYPEGGNWLVDDSTSKARTRGGPWRWTFENGESEVIHTGTLSDAKSILRLKLRRKTLPRGTTWKLEQR